MQDDMLFEMSDDEQSLQAPATPARHNLVNENIPTIAPTIGPTPDSKASPSPAAATTGRKMSGSRLTRPAQLRLQADQLSSASQSQTELSSSVREMEFVDQVREKLREIRGSPETASVQPEWFFSSNN